MALPRERNIEQDPNPVVLEWKCKEDCKTRAKAQEKTRSQRVTPAPRRVEAAGQGLGMKIFMHG